MRELIEKFKELGREEKQEILEELQNIFIEDMVREDNIEFIDNNKKLLDSLQDEVKE